MTVKASSRNNKKSADRRGKVAIKSGRVIATKTAHKATRKMGKSKPAPPPSYYERPSGILVQSNLEYVHAVPVPPKIMADGIKKVHDKIRKLIDAIIDIPLKTGYEIDEINVALSFNAKGEFLGIGVGGAATVGMKIKPSND